MKKNISIFLALVMCMLFSVPALAASSDSNPAEFVPLTREEYISHKADRLGISYEEAEALVDENIENTLAMIPMATDGFTPVGGWTDEYGVSTTYGYIEYEKPVPRTDSYMTVLMSVYTTIISAPPGRYIAEVDTPEVFPGSSGYYTLDASCNVSVPSNKQSVVLSATGNAEITLSHAKDMGLSAEIISYGQSIGTTEYLRYPFTVGATYRV